MFRIFFLIFFIFLLACSENELETKDFALAYAELRIAEREYGEKQTGSIIRDEILQKHELTAETFEESLENIRQETKIWKKFQKEVVEAIDSIIAAQTKKAEKTEEEEKAE